MNYIKIKVEDVPTNNPEVTEPVYEQIPYDAMYNGWYVNSERVNGVTGFYQYAHSDVNERDVRQLLKKEFDIRY